MFGSEESGLPRECTEETPTRPVSLYGATKLAAEKQVLRAGGVVFRLATVFGVSPRFRCDLLIHDLARIALKDKRLEIYQVTRDKGWPQKNCEHIKLIILMKLSQIWITR